MAKVHIETNPNSRQLAFCCPGCRMIHTVPIEGSGITNWKWDGNMEQPTLTPSVLSTWPPTERRCHLNIDAGVITFHGDCSHDLKSQRVELPEWAGWNWPPE